MLVRRLDRGLVEWFNTQKNSVLVLTGEGTAHPMAELLSKHSVPPQAIYTETEGCNTLETAYKVAKMLLGTNVKIVKLITSDFHAVRARKCFTKALNGKVYLSDINVPSGLAPEELSIAVHKETQML